MHGYRLSQFVALVLLVMAMSPLMQLAGAEGVIELRAGCTLYDAIVAANTDSESGSCPAGRGADTIRLTADIMLDRELPSIVSTISIEGEGHKIDALQYVRGTRDDGTTYVMYGEFVYRIFHIETTGTLNIHSLELSGGFAEHGAAIHNQGIVEVHNSRLTKNLVLESGGAIFNQGVARIYTSHLSDNQARYSGAAVYSDVGKLEIVSSTFEGNSVNKGTNGGGAVFATGKTIVSDSRFRENKAPYGAAITNKGEMSLLRSVVEANETKYQGAVRNYGWLTIERSEISDNESVGIHSQGPTSRLVISNTTISGNKGHQYGGGISTYGTTILTHVTIVDNVAEKGGGIHRHETMGGLVILRNSIVADNIGGDCTVGLHENTNSIIGDGSCSAPTNDTLLFDPAADSYQPWRDSPAVAAADPLYCTPVDQLGNPRPTDQPCDIGAVESPYPYTSPETSHRPRTTRTPTKCTLKDQIIAFNTDAPFGACPAGDGADTIDLDDVYISEDPFPLRITSDITIEGNGGVIRDYYSRHQLFEVLGGHLTLRNVTLIGGYSPWTGGAIAVLKSRLTLQNVTIRDSSATFGGAIFNDGGQVDIADSRFINNRAIDLGSWDSGAGGAIFNSGALRIGNSLFSANQAAVGGAVSNRGTGAHAEITNSKFASNSVSDSGGALANGVVGQMRVAGSLFLDNVATGHEVYPTSPGFGGAISSLDVIHIQNSTFSLNRAGYGGAIYLDHPKATLVHITVAQNSGQDLYVVDHSEKGFIKVVNSLIADDGCWVSDYLFDFVSVGNLIEDGSCKADLQGDPLLTPFDALTDMISLQAGSPAIDAADPEYCLPVDQLGAPRPLGGGCDIGAIEFVPEQP